MGPRIDLRTVAPHASRGFRQASADAKEHGIEESLKHLVDVRASQINGCGYCLEMHVSEAKAIGETDDRLHLLAVWRDAECFTPRERAALAWTEAVTLVAQTGVPDDVYHHARQQFTEEELVYLTVGIAAINAFNRVNVALRTPIGASRLAVR